MTRHQMRQSALALIFATSFSENFDETCQAAQEVEYLPINDDVVTLASAVTVHAEELDQRIEKYLKQWTLQRIPRLSLSILRLAFYEILYMPEIDPPISINEAVELTKEYMTQQDAAFVNGVLGSFSKEWDQ